EEAKKIIREISKEHSNATHNCWAYKVGVDFPQKHYSDGGEPSGTAGKPILGEIERANLTNAVIVVTRYFGGIKLGVRGLIEAYGQTAREAIKAAGVVRKVKGKEIMIEVPYDKQSLIYSQFKSMGIDDSNWEALYGEKVRLYGKIPDFLVEEVEELLSNYVGQGWVFSWSWVDGAY
ncbi:MAG TPA: YigZ family protein, partial [Acetomicrobium sp.]